MAPDNRSNGLADRLVADELHRLNEKVDKLVTEVAMLKGRATAWGAVAGFICSAIVAIVSAIMSTFKHGN